MLDTTGKSIGGYHSVNFTSCIMLYPDKGLRHWKFMSLVANKTSHKRQTKCPQATTLPSKSIAAKARLAPRIVRTFLQVGGGPWTNQVQQCCGCYSWIFFWGIDHRVLLFFFVSGEVLSSHELVLVILLLLSCCNFVCWLRFISFAVALSFLITIVGMWCWCSSGFRLSLFLLHSFMDGWYQLDILSPYKIQ